MPEPRSNFAYTGVTWDEPITVPAGYRLIARRTRLGVGDGVLDFAISEVKSWGVKTRVGFRVSASTAESSAEVSAGDTYVVSLGPVREPVRVAWVESNGFGYETLAGHPLSGEEAFILEQDSSGTVWLVNRSVSRPATTLWRILSPLLRLAQWYFVGAYGRSLRHAVAAVDEGAQVLELWEQPVTYAAVGATQAADLMYYPPTGYRPVERSTRIGHGVERFEFAWTEAMSWGIQKRSGMRVDVAEAPSEVTDTTYVPVSFDAEGVPLEPAVTSSGEATFGPDGEPFLQPGDTATLAIPFGLFRVRAPARVVYVVDEPERKGFAYGTLRGHPENGEEAFLVEKRADDSVWLTIKAFSRPANRWWWLVYPVLRVTQEVFTRRYERALTGPLGS
jgi:uncharacterized protein (UPF0548 family)